MLTTISFSMTDRSRTCPTRTATLASYTTEVTFGVSWWIDADSIDAKCF